MAQELDYEFALYLCNCYNKSRNVPIPYHAYACAYRKYREDEDEMEMSRKDSDGGGIPVPEAFRELIKSGQSLTSFIPISKTQLIYGQGLCAECGQHANYYPGGKRLRTHAGRGGGICRHRKAIKPVGILPAGKTLLGFPVVEADIPENTVILFGDFSNWVAAKNVGRNVAKEKT
jgi:hypothetical protein